MVAERKIEDIEQELDRLEDEERALREELDKAQLERYEGQFEDLFVQVSLASMEVRDRVEPIVQRVRDQLIELRARIETGATSASDAVEALRGGVEEAWQHVRTALAEARAKAPIGS